MYGYFQDATLECSEARPCLRRPMKRILFVDDDPLVLRLYRDGLRLRGFEVEGAEDGLAAAKLLQQAKPDAMVLDLMMPKLSGIAVLKYVRAQPNLAKLPVVVLSNAYTTDLAREAAAAGADKGLLKAGCTPAALADILKGLLNVQQTSPDGTELSCAPAAEPVERGTETEPPGTPAPLPGSSSPQTPAGAFSRQSLPSEDQTETQSTARFREDFLKKGAASLSSVRGLFRAFHKARDDAERKLELESLYREVHLLAVSARAAECHHLTRMASVLEALLLKLVTSPAWITPSVLSTIANAIDLFGSLLEHDQKAASGSPPPGEILVLVLDNDQVSRHVMVSALRNAHFKAEGAGDPVSTLDWLSEKHYDLILLDLEMPGMDGFEFCRRVRQLPACRNTPIIYVTAHSEFENRVKGTLSGGQDLLAKPIIPTELAVKVVTQTIKSRLLTVAGPSRRKGT